MPGNTRLKNEELNNEEYQSIRIRAASRVRLRHPAAIGHWDRCCVIIPVNEFSNHCLRARRGDAGWGSICARPQRGLPRRASHGRDSRSHVAPAPRQLSCLVRRVGFHPLDCGGSPGIRLFQEPRAAIVFSRFRHGLCAHCRAPALGDWDKSAVWTSSRCSLALSRELGAGRPVAKSGGGGRHAHLGHQSRLELAAISGVGRACGASIPAPHICFYSFGW